MSARPQWILRQGLLPIMIAHGVVAAVAFGFYDFEPTTLRIAMAPRDGTEPELFAAFATALVERKEDDDVKASAAALDAGQTDLAVIRPDVMLPSHGPTVAVLRDQPL